MSNNNLKYFLRILIDNVINNEESPVDNQNENDGPKNLDYPQLLEDKERHSSYLWLIVIDLLIFIGLTVILYSSSKKLIQKNGTANSIADDFKPKFVKGLIYANGSKTSLFNFSQSNFSHIYNSFGK
jgi:hypothetical protein